MQIVRTVRLGFRGLSNSFPVPMMSANEKELSEEERLEQDKVNAEREGKLVVP